MSATATPVRRQTRPARGARPVLDEAAGRGPSSAPGPPTRAACETDRAQPLHRRRLGRLRRRHLQPGHQPVRREPSSPRSTSPPTTRSRPRSRPRAAPSTRPTGRARPTGDRAALLDRVAGLIDRDLEAMARLETLNTGKAMRESRWDMADVARVFRYYADLADKEAGRLVDTSNPDALSRIVYEPIGVCGLIGPWNYPLLQLSWKIAPALAAGNTAVMKPAQVTPLTAIHLTRLLEEAGVAARRRQPRARARASASARRSADSPDVDLISLTGGLEAGRALMRGAAGQRQAGRARDRRQEPQHRVRRRRLRDGRRQRPDRRLHPLRPGLLGRLPGDRPGHDLRPRSSRRSAARADADPARPRDATTRPKPARSSPPTHRAKVEAYVAGALAEGARLVAGGRRPDEPELQAGFFYRPTVFADVTPRRCGSSARRSSGRS